MYISIKNTMNSFHNLSKNYPMFSLNKTISSMNTIIDKNKESESEK